MLAATRPYDPRYGATPIKDGTKDGTEVDATLSYILLRYPVLDLYNRYTYAKEAGLDQLVTATEGYFLTETSMHEANPQEIRDRREPVALPPTLLVQGSADADVPLSILKRFTSAYTQAGGLIESEILPEIPHGFDVRPGPTTDLDLDPLKHFIARRLAALEEVG